MEYDSLAIRFDHYPNFSVDMAARIEHIKQQSRESYKKVRDFFIHYQDRILYGTDMEVCPPLGNNGSVF
jgi:predicted TIM-barrel fold metal-dependent hydrolase